MRSRHLLSLLLPLLVSLALFAQPGRACAGAAAELPAPPSGEKAALHFTQRLRALRAAHPALLFLGDSIVAETRSADPRFGDIAATWRRAYGCRGGFALGFGGDTTGTLLWRLQQGALAGQAPRLVVILIGTDDIAVRGGANPHEAADGIHAVVAATRAALPASRILVLGLLPRERFNRKRRMVNRLLAAMAWDRLGATYFDPGAALALANGRPDPRYFRETALGKPMLNPNAAGWERLVAAIEPPIEAALGGKTCR